jgi:Lon protease-like protein
MAVLPLFPLSVVLFPGAFLPLHVFEPRYRKMLVDVVEGGHRFVILPPGPGESPPAPGTIGTVARVRAVQPLADGRSNIVVSGDERVTLSRVLEATTPYLMGDAEGLPDLPDTQVPTTTEVTRLRELGERYAGELATLETTSGEREPEWSDDPGLLSFQIAALAEWEEVAQRRFLEIRSATERVTRLLASLPSLIADAAGRAKIHQRATQNGTGHR